MKIISGAQTGADRGGLDAAIELGLEYGGWVPKGRRSEDGQVPAQYEHMVETEATGYTPRTEKNVSESDGTVIFTYGIFTYGRGGPGSRLTVGHAREHAKPLLHINLDDVSLDDAVVFVKDFIERYKIQCLNVAGSRESRWPGIQEVVKSILVKALG